MNRCEGGELHAVGNDRPMKDKEKRYDEDRYAEKSSRLLFRRRIESPGESRPVILGHQPAASGHHRLGRLGSPGTVGIAVTAIITEPRFRRFQQFVSQAELEVAIDFPGERVFPGRQRTCGCTVAALHAGFDVPGPKTFNLIAQIRVDVVSLHDLPFKSPHAGDRKSLSGLSENVFVSSKCISYLTRRYASRFRPASASSGMVCHRTGRIATQVFPGLHLPASRPLSSLCRRNNRHSCTLDRKA